MMFSNASGDSKKRCIRHNFGLSIEKFGVYTGGRQHQVFDASKHPLPISLFLNKFIFNSAKSTNGTIPAKYLSGS